MAELSVCTGIYSVKKQRVGPFLNSCRMMLKKLGNHADNYIYRDDVDAQFNCNKLIKAIYLNACVLECFTNVDRLYSSL